MNKMTDDKKVLEALYRNNFAAFVRRCITELYPLLDYQHSWHIDAICFELDRLRRGEITRLVINVPPRYLKSTIASVCLPAFVLGRDPSKQVMVVSYGTTLAVELSNLTRALMKSDFYRALFPHTVISPSKDTETMFKTTLGGYRFGLSLGGPILGHGADLIIVDDPVKPEDAYSQPAMDKANVFLTTTLVSRLNDKKTGGIGMVMQRLSPSDPTSYVLGKGNWQHLKLPMIATSKETITLGHGEFHQREPGELLHPERDDEETIEKLRKEFGEDGFLAQFQQAPVALGSHIFKLEQFKRYEKIPPLHFFQCLVQSWDPAVTASDTSDYSVCTTWGKRGDDYYLLDIFRMKLEYPDLEAMVWHQYLKWKPKLVILEGSHIGLALRAKYYLKVPSTFRTLSPTTSKVERAAVQSSKVAAGHVYLPEEADGLEAFEAEVVAFGSARHDDQVDSMVQFLRAMDYAIPGVNM